MSAPTKSPSVILVRPQLGENIGAVARAMANFGLSELRLVAPRDGWHNVKTRAREVASGGEHIIDSAQVFPTTAASLADIQLAYATTARMRDIEKRVVAPAGAMEEIKTQAQGNRVALMFGPERTGLENDDVSLVDAFITIPTDPDYFSLNIAQSAVVIFYEWFKSTGATVSRDLPEIASKKDWEELFTQLEPWLDEVKYWRVDDKKPLMWQNLKNMLLRGQWSEQEIRTFRGMLRLLYEKPRNK